MSHLYTIYNVTRERENFAKRIRLSLSGWSERQVRCFNGSDPRDLAKGCLRWNYPIHESNGFPRVGHLGIWYSVLNALDEGGPLFTFDDDARLSPLFQSTAEQYIEELPVDADFLALYRSGTTLPHMVSQVSDSLSRAYQPNGGAAFYWTEKGARKFMELTKHFGLTGQYDNVMYAYSWAGEMNGYQALPQEPPIVYTERVPTTVQNTEEFSEHRLHQHHAGGPA